MTSNFLLKALLTLLAVAVALATVHFYLVKNVLPAIYGSGAWWANYVFNGLVSVFVVVVCYVVYKADHKAVGKTYFVFVFLKMFGSVGFLYPWLFPKTDFSLPMVHQFFVVFFVLLFVEVKLLVRLLNSGSGELSKNHENQ